VTSSTQEPVEARKSPSKNVTDNRIGKALGPVVTALTIIAMLATIGDSLHDVAPPIFVFTLVVAAVAWVGVIAYISIGCAVRQFHAKVDKASAKVTKQIRDGHEKILAEVKRNRIEIMALSMPGAASGEHTLRSVN
jgi:hypothetical protein